MEKAYLNIAEKINQDNEKKKFKTNCMCLRSMTQLLVYTWRESNNHNRLKSCRDVQSKSTL